MVFKRQKGSVVVQVRVGKEFPGMRQNERRIRCVRVGRGESLPALPAMVNRGP